MSPFENDLLVTALDILSFFCVTTDLYGRLVLALDRAKAGINPEYYQLMRNVGFLVAGQDWFSKFVIRSLIAIFEKSNVKNLLIGLGAVFFLLGRGVSLYYLYTHD